MKYLLIFLTVLLVLGHALAQTDKRVADIRKKVEQINRDSGYIKKELDNEQFLEHMTDGGGALVGYYKNKTLAKIDLWVGLSSYIITDEYYFKNDSLIFIYEQKDFEYVDSLATFDYNKQTITVEYRYYFKDNKLIKVDSKGQPRFDSQPVSNGKDLLSDCVKYETILKEAKK